MSFEIARQVQNERRHICIQMLFFVFFQYSALKHKHIHKRIKILWKLKDEIDKKIYAKNETSKKAKNFFFQNLIVEIRLFLLENFRRTHKKTIKEAATCTAHDRSQRILNLNCVYKCLRRIIFEVRTAHMLCLSNALPC